MGRRINSERGDPFTTFVGSANDIANLLGDLRRGVSRRLRTRFHYCCVVDSSIR